MRYPLPVLFICGLAFAVPSPSHHVFERRQVEPHGWVQGRRLEVDFMLPMRFGLIQNNLNYLDDMLMAVSHPDSPVTVNTGRRLTSSINSSQPPK